MRLCIHAGKHFEGACKTHSGEKSNKCNQCMFASSHTSALRTHLKRHSGERPYKCNQCDYASSQAVHLIIHLKTHSEEKSNKCNQFDLTSSQALHLKIHLKIHSGEKSNKCNLSIQADFGPLPLFCQQFFTTVCLQIWHIWQIFDPLPLKVTYVPC